MTHRLRWAAGAGVTVALLAGTAFVGPAESRPPTPAEQGKQDTEMIARAPRRTKAAPPMVMGVFKNGQFHIIKLRSEVSEIVTPDGATTVERRSVSTQAEAVAQLPPDDPRFYGVGPTPDQISEMKTRVQAEEDKIRSEWEATP